MRLVVLVAALSCALASCESTTTQIGKTGPGDASFPSGTGGSGNAADAGVACGATRCGPTEICVYPPCGCIVETAPKTSSGGCPDGDVPDPSLGCYLPPGCPRQPAYCATPGMDGQVFECSGDNGTLNGLVDGPIPEGSIRVCYDSCV